MANEGNLLAFSDDANISDWSKAQIYELYTAGVVSAYDNGAFVPTESVTRA